MPLPLPSSANDPAMSLLFYRPGRAMPCPSCGESQWLVGRVMAQCACCDAAMPIDGAYRGWSGGGASFRRPERLPIA
ncbi:hypothetical protein RLDS_04555 [Sphingobium lactosutens DS20]|uniref:Uncharacterized protein n=2 Tax=Sphingobium TaxID=165695 RepID=T0HLJ2_9SPHN|nr:hypothetical protein RLDS_04555 [Sphingobium lactosutens DS20]